MRVAIIADIHANLEALTAVLSDIEGKGGVNETWCLGDIVGYGPDPVRCIEHVQRYCNICIAGNHDRAVAGKLELSFFNPLAETACKWTITRLPEEHLKYLEELPLTAEKGGFLLVHGSPADPLLEYIMSTGIAARNFGYFKAECCLVGHTHVPAVFKEAKETAISVPLSPGIGLVFGSRRMIINPGGVGQPRDGDPRASYAVYDSEGHVLRLYRVPYDIAATQDKIMKAGLPVHLATRLSEGQ